MNDPINHPSHYTNGPKCQHCGNVIEAIDVTKHFGFCLGNAVKYIWRAGLKGSKDEDLKKALWYLKQAQKDIEEALSDPS